MHGLMCFKAFKRLTGLAKYKWLLITSNIKQLYHYGTKELNHFKIETLLYALLCDP